MPYSFPEIRKFAGLFLQKNSFDIVPDGAFEIAQNIVLQSDDVISKVKGIYEYYSSGTAEEWKGLFRYDGYLFGITANVSTLAGIVSRFTDDSSLDSYSPLGTRTNLSGDRFTNFNFAYRNRAVEASQNLYFTSSAGLMKLNQDFTSSTTYYVKRAGVPPGLDLTLTEGTTATGPLDPDTQTAFRVVFGRKDSKGNLLLSAPSDIATIGIAADGTGVNYTSSGAGPYTVTVTTSSAHGLTSSQEIIVSNATDADADGTQTITVTGATTFTYSTAANPGAGTLDYTFSREINIYATVPSEIDDVNDQWFVRVYRSSSSASLSTSPIPDFKLSKEVLLTSLDISTKSVFITDDVDSSLLGAELYTNPNSGEGELQANARPPMAKDICLYKGYLFFLSTVSRQRLSLQMINTSELASNTIYFKFGSTEGYVSRQPASGVGNDTYAATSVSGTGTVTITYAAHGMSNGWTVFIFDVTGSVPRGTYPISGVTANTFDISSPGNTATALYFSAMTNGTDAVFTLDISSSSIAERIENTAKALVRAINRNSSLIYANYASNFDTVPGLITVETKGFSTTDTLYVRGSLTNNGFIQPLPSSFSSGTQVSSEIDSYLNGLMYSKLGEVEAVPLVNFDEVGSRNSEAWRCFAMTDAIIFLKEDGAFKLVGDNPSNFDIVPIDTTVSFLSGNAADKINNAVIAVCDQGVVKVTETSVQIISRDIEDDIQVLVSSPGQMEICGAFGFETARLWFFSVPFAVGHISAKTYIYNVINNSWTTTDETFRYAAIGPSGIYSSPTMYQTEGDESTKIYRRRFTNTKIDYCNEFMPATALADAGGLTAYVEPTDREDLFIVQPGDIVVLDGVINRITAATRSGPGYEVTFLRASNISTSVADDVIIYEAIESRLKFVPFHAGQVSREKLFAEFHIHLRQAAMSKLRINFGSAYFAATNNVNWTEVDTLLNDSEGWGLEPWGLFPWGQSLSEVITQSSGTLPAPIIRTYVSEYAARTTYLQPYLVHRQAGENMLIQAVSYAVLGYGFKTSR